MKKVFNDRIDSILESIKKWEQNIPDNYKPFKIPSRYDGVMKSVSHDKAGEADTINLSNYLLYFDYAGLWVKPIFNKNKTEYWIWPWTFKLMMKDSNPKKIADYLNDKWKTSWEQYSKEQIKWDFDTNFEKAKKIIWFERDISKANESLNNMEQYLEKNKQSPKYNENLKKYQELKKVYDYLVGLDKTWIWKFNSDYKNADSKLNNVTKILKDNSSNTIAENTKRELHMELENIEKILLEMETRLASQTDKSIIKQNKLYLNKLRKKYAEIISWTGWSASWVDSDILENLYTEDKSEDMINKALDPKNIDAELEWINKPADLISVYSNKIDSYNTNRKKFAWVKEQYPRYMAKLWEEIFSRLKGKVLNGWNNDNLRQYMLLFANLMRWTPAIKSYKEQLRLDTNSIYNRDAKVKDIISKNISSWALTYTWNELNDMKLSKEILSYLSLDPVMGIKKLFTKVDILSDSSLKNLEIRKSYLTKYWIKMTDNKVMRKDPKNPNWPEIIDAEMTNIMTKNYESLWFKEKIILQSYKDYENSWKPNFPIALDSPEKIKTFAERFGNILDENFKWWKHIQQLDKQNLSSADLWLTGTNKLIYDTLRDSYWFSYWRESDENFYKWLGSASMVISMAAGAACMFIPFGQWAGAVLLSMTVASLVGIAADQLLNDDSNEGLNWFTDIASQIWFDMVSAFVTLWLSTKAMPLIRSIPRLQKILATWTKDANKISKIINWTIDFVDLAQWVTTELVRQDIMYGNAFNNPDLIFNQLWVALGM